MNSTAAHLHVVRHTNNFDEIICVQGCVQQKMQYQQQFYQHFYPVMMAAILRYTSDRDEGASIVNNGFLRVFKNIKTFKHQGSLEGWVRKIMIHSVSDYFRYKHSPVEISTEIIPDTTSTNINISSQYDYNKLLHILNELPQTTRVVINLFIIDNYTHKDIAQMLGMSENTSKWHVANGRKILQEKMASYNEK